MKKILIFLTAMLLSLSAFGQGNEYRCVLNLYGGLKVGSESRIASMAPIDSVKIESDLMTI